ncbi:protein containing DUF1566 [Sulfurimonas gotlandica GD1]|uniref:Protein containing DUF1566 n=1 Tax=Sulfurimonas gotlandica (strain DSM 19862 / JCM 16533 / GD1) TaxID=929558 RepID=B6BMA3_SULGG|nr:DUF1566 domain-containing protein [Sulfurimonas gotlandica]EDZ61692.1 conserved domain protein [Sulfurimonas gotlandica GD1]EHP29319.1 protein containing DUF1566 [Sulfurimonas gotlandica GD1]
MIRILLQITLITTTLFSYEIGLGKSSNKDKKVTESKPKIALVRDDSKELVIDKNTGLMWQDNIDAKTIRKNRKDAKQYCRSLVFAGYDDWYLPRLRELKSIIDESKYNPAIRYGFKNVASGHYWSSSPNLSDIVIALNVDFKSGQTYNNTRKGKGYVRCVRGNYNSLI